MDLLVSWSFDILFIYVLRFIEQVYVQKQKSLERINHNKITAFNFVFIELHFGYKIMRIYEWI